MSSIENKVNMKVDVEGATTSLIISNKVVSNNFSLSNSLNITVDFKKLRKESCIGKGSFGSVFMCTHPSYKERKFAVKHIFPNDVSFDWNMDYILKSPLNNAKIPLKNTKISQRLFLLKKPKITLKITVEVKWICCRENFVYFLGIFIQYF